MDEERWAINDDEMNGGERCETEILTTRQRPCLHQERNKGKYSRNGRINEMNYTIVLHALRV